MIDNLSRDQLRCNLDDASLKGLIIKKAPLRGASLRAADFKGAHFKNMNMTWIDMVDAELKGAKLYTYQIYCIKLSVTPHCHEISDSSEKEGKFKGQCTAKFYQPDIERSWAV